MQVKLDDDLVEQYQAMAPGKPLAPILERQLARFSAYPPGTRVVVLARDVLQEIEGIVGGGQIQTPGHLLDRIKGLSRVRIGQVDIPLSPSQQEEILVRAAKQGKTPEAVVVDLVAQITDQMFYGTVPTR